MAITGEHIDDVRPTRIVRLVLVDRGGQVLGALPPFPVDVPWWPDAVAVVAGARERYGVEVVVLRLLDAERPSPPGGAVTYLAEVRGDVPARVVEPWAGQLAEHPLRQRWARPGGPDADLAWADCVLAAHGRERTSAEQIRTWNLSSLWRLGTTDGTAWLKVVPPFFAHEAALLEQLAGKAVPRLLGREGERTLMPEVPGEDLYDAPQPVLKAMVRLLVELQADCASHVDELVALGLPDWRADALIPPIADIVTRAADELTAEDRATLAGFVDALPDRFRRVAEAGVPDTLVHGDFHPGNFRGDAESLVLLDWGDSGVGNPLLDQAAYLDRIRPNLFEAIRAVWRRAWLAHALASDPDRAAALVAPVAAARQAVIYRKFLDKIEPSEQPYHRKDPAEWLAKTAAIVRAERSDARGGRG
ncbi:MAG: aminoglycoside phosphotransferase family protein [Chloroflexota bacterium]